MHQVRLIKTVSAKGFETKLNDFLFQLGKDKLVDIKYSTVIDGSSVSYSALVVYIE